MSLADHLREVRKRLIISAIGMVVAMIVAFILTDPIIVAMTEPVRIVQELRGEEANVSFMYTTITGAFDQRLRISFAVGILLSAPIWLWQIWAFLMPGLTRKEIRYTIGFAAAAIPLFFAGAFVGWLVMPHIIEVMAGFTTDFASNNYDAKLYYDFIFKLVLAVGIAFVLPVFLVALNFAGIMSGKAIAKGWRTAVLIACLFAGLATPAADIPSMLLLAGVLTVLYFLAAGLTLLLDRRRAKRAPKLLEPSA
ncbi:twin-arginine translocase subunit TatC [Microbacterium sp. No. 7]|uniref:twin-arginine translocase subunit TatC n=1 Tax=Microbacterium sp. No. 7 TaxID=1714373 RepID=UPI0006D19642|nr:twin-arginine translocase subunit TatC [Microbacterium sp. No. 7]